MRLVIVFAVAFALAAPMSARADGFFTGNELLGWCSKTETALACTGYVTGATDTALHYQGAKIATKAICVPQGVAVSQAVDIAVAYLRNHPESRQYSAASLVWWALKEAWGCQ